jgi:hypothetical protein
VPLTDVAQVEQLFECGLLVKAPKDDLQELCLLGRQLFGDQIRRSTDS